MSTAESVTDTGWGMWSSLPNVGSKLAHRVRPAGGDGRWQTACGRVLTGPRPVAAPAGLRRCAHCARQDRADGGRYRQMPPRHGRHTHRAVTG